MKLTQCRDDFCRQEKARLQMRTCGAVPNIRIKTLVCVTDHQISPLLLENAHA